MGVADVPPRVAAADAGPGADRGRAGRHRRRRGGGHQHPAAGRRGLRHGPGHGYVPAGRRETGQPAAGQPAAGRHENGQPDRRARASLWSRGRDREPGRRHSRLDQHLRPARPEPGRPVRPADALPAIRALPGRPGPGRRDPERGHHLQPQDRRYVAPGRTGPPGHRHRAEPAEPAGRVRPRRAGSGQHAKPGHRAVHRAARQERRRLTRLRQPVRGDPA